MSSAGALLLLLLGSLAATEAQLTVFDLRASGLRSAIVLVTDAYVHVFCGSTSLGKTSVVNNNANPWWEEEFTYFRAQENDVLRLEVYDKDLVFDDLLGTCQRRIKPGTNTHECYLERGGTLRYTYTLG